LRSPQRVAVANVTNFHDNGGAMRNRKLTQILRCVLCVLIAAATTTAAQSTKSVYAVKDAKVYTVSGAVLAKGTVVIRNGLIESVGTQIAIPPEATVIEGNGLTVFPGLIDSFSDTGLPAAAVPAGSTANPGVGTPPAPPQPAPKNAREALFQTALGLEPGRILAQQVRADGRNVEAYRLLGITSALAVSRDGILTGQSVLINTSDSNIVVKSPVALHINPAAMNGGYPATLMGAFAVLRQTFSDADWYRQVWQRFNTNPRGIERPEYSKTLDSMAEIARNNLPSVIHANWAHEIRRAVALADELKLKAIIAGGVEASDVASLLKAKNIPVLVSVNSSIEKTRPSFSDTGPADLDDREKKDLLRNAALLADAGVRFALQSGFAERPQLFIDNIRIAIDNGLPTERALRAATLAAAEILGVDGALGSLDAGKIANLVVATGEPFARDTAIRHVFVDGKRFDPPAQTANTTQRPAAAATPTATAAARPAVKAGSYLTPTPGEVLIRNATVLTVSNGTLRNGSILVRNGKIAAVGTNIAAPPAALVIDGAGKFVMPGIIDAHAHVAIDGGINEGTSPITPHVRIGDVIREDDVAIYRAVAGGTTTANVLHGSANVIGGTNAVIKLKWGRAANELVFGAPLGVKLALGENPKRSNANQPQDNRRYPATRMGVEDLLRQAFTEARLYALDWDNYEARRRRGEDVIPPRRDLKLETLADVLQGKILVHAHSYIEPEIVMLLNLADEFGFKIKTLQHVLEGYKVAKEIAAHGAGASTFVDFWGYKVEAWDAIPYNAALMKKFGVNVSINSDDNSRMRRLYEEAARALHYSNGEMTETDALKMITLNPAMQLDIADRVGTIEVGKDADLAIFNGHPFSSYSLVEMTMIEGQIYFDRELDLKARETRGSN
jgi:imidazolonepropionase-like amidohydrolase